MTQHETTETPSPFMTAQEVAALLRLSSTTVYRLADAHKIPHFRISHALRFDRKEVETWARESACALS